MTQPPRPQSLRGAIQSGSRSNLAGHLRDRLARLRIELAQSPAGERQAGHAALYDKVTTLPNRVHLRGRLAQVLPPLLQAGQPLGLLCLGLEGFSRVGETHGHAANDESLRIVAARLRHSVRTVDMIGRVDEGVFACLLPEVADPGRLGAIARRLLVAVGAPMRIGSIELELPAHVGVAIAPGDAQDADGLLGNAGAAMYRAVRQHCDHAFYGQPTGR